MDEFFFLIIIPYFNQFINIFLTLKTLCFRVFSRLEIGENGFVKLILVITVYLFRFIF